jgi:hypothetical protein
MTPPEGPGNRGGNRWLLIGLALGAAIMLLFLVLMTPSNETTPYPDTTNAGPSVVQPVPTTPQPKTP